jgi:hypothetical protein
MKNCKWCSLEVKQSVHPYRAEIAKTVVKLHQECRDELKRIRFFLGKDEFWKLIKENGLTIGDVFSCYKDFEKPKMSLINRIRKTQLDRMKKLRYNVSINAINE